VVGSSITIARSTVLVTCDPAAVGVDWTRYGRLTRHAYTEE